MHGRRDVVPLDRILPHIRSSHPGKFYDAEGPFMDPAGRLHYRIKWMTPEGRIVWLDTDARTGRVLGVNHGWGGFGPYPGGELRPPRDDRDFPRERFDGPPRWDDRPGWRERPARGNWHGGREGPRGGGGHGSQGRPGG